MEIQKSRVGVLARAAGTKAHALAPPLFYDEAPQGDISIDEFAEYAQTRITVLRELDKVCGYESSLAASLRALDENDTRIEQLLAKHGLLDTAKQDAIGHNILRVALSRTPENQQWFIRNEERLFAYRLGRYFKLAEPRQVQALLRSHGCLPFGDASIVDGSAKPGFAQLGAWAAATTPAEFYQELISVTYGAEAGRERFFALPFALLPPGLVAMHKVLIRGGTGFLPSSELRQLLSRRFKANLEKGMSHAPAIYAAMERNPQLGTLLKQMGSVSWSGAAISMEGIADEERVNMGNWQQVVPRSFPPCMRVLVDQMCRNRKHLKYDGRVQLQSFFKAAGFTLDESKVWWRAAMCRDPKVDSGKFDKEYLYGINYTYGKCGNMKEKSPCKCATTINMSFPSGEQSHGCPFRHSDLEQLLPMLRGWGISESESQAIKTKVQGHHYQLACRDFFKAKHPNSDGEDMGNHPLQFYQESMRYHLAQEAAGKKDGKKADVSTAERLGA